MSAEIPSVYERYLALAGLAGAEFGGTLGGRIVAVPTLAPEASWLILAAGIASAASLAIESDLLRIRLAIRQRICEFTVNTLDETIRILKNQVRQRQAVAVCLSSGLSPALGEMLDRGLQPDLIALPANGFGNYEESRLMARLIARGSRALDLAGPAQAPVWGIGSTADGCVDVRWRVTQAPGIWLPKIDSIFEQCFPGDPRCRWIRVAPLYFDRALQFERFVRLRPEEAGAFLTILTGTLRSGEIPVPVKFALGAGHEPQVIV
jgi:hypothetical protein